MPPLIPLLLLDRLLKHGLHPTISVTWGHSCSCRIPQRPPSAGRGYEVTLTVERPLFPLLTHAIPHDEPRHVVVRALMQVVGPAFEHGGACHLHVKDLQPLVEAGHLTYEVLQAAPRALCIFCQQLPHLVEAAFGVELHEAHLEACGCGRGWRRWPQRLHRGGGCGDPRGGPGPWIIKAGAGWKR